jgi:hypothetical protein
MWTMEDSSKLAPEDDAAVRALEVPGFAACDEPCRPSGHAVHA